jgi:hypothetical protein
MTRHDLEAAFRDCVKRAWRENALAALESVGYSFWTKVPDDKIPEAIKALKAVPTTGQISAFASASRGSMSMTDRLTNLVEQVYGRRNRS